MTGNHGESDRQRIQTGLRDFQLENEIKGSHSSSFRPSFVTFGHELDREFGAVEPRATTGSILPAFASLPTIRLLKSGASAASNSRHMHQAKSFLQYNYRFGSQATHGSSGKTLAAALGIGDNSEPGVSEFWCLVVDESKLLPLPTGQW